MGKKLIRPGDRCIIIKSNCGDEGKIVVVDRNFNPSDETFDNCCWDFACDVLVTSCGSYLRSWSNADPTPMLHRTRPYRSDWLRKIPEVHDPELQLKEVV